MENIHEITVCEKKKGSCSGVAEVDSFTGDKIAVTLSDKTRLFIRGANLKILAFSKQTGIMSFEGAVGEIKYGEKQVSIVKKIFK